MDATIAEDDPKKYRREERMSVTLLKRLFTVEEYRKMGESGILKEGDRLELIRGEIIQMSPTGPVHAAYVKHLNEIFISRLAGRVIVGVQDPVELDDKSEPQPDLALLQRRTDFYKSGHPRSQDVLLLVEVADTTIKSDRDIKIPLYAEDKIPEVWLVNVNEYCLEVYREPTADGYQNVQRLEEGQTVTVQAFPDIVFTVDELLG